MILPTLVLALGAGSAGPGAVAPAEGDPTGESQPMEARTSPAQDPGALIHGQILSKGTRRPIPGAWIQLETGANLVTDADGRFEWRGDAGNICLSVGAAGFRPASFCEQVSKAQRLDVLYSIEPLDVNPYETVVTGQRDRVEVSRVSLRDQEILEVPGTMGDPFRVIMLMPGVSSLASGLSYPVVRGGQPAATGFFIDGVRVPMLYHVLLGPAVVQPELLDRVDFLPGSLPVRYGQLTGGVVDARIREPADRFRATAYVDLLNSAALVDYPSPSTGTNVILAGRMSYSALLFSLASNLTAGDQLQRGNYSTRETYSANFWDYQARAEQKLGGFHLRLLALGSSDSFGSDQESLRPAPGTGASPGEPRPMAAITEGIRLRETFHRLDVRGRRKVAGGELELGATLGTDELGGSNTLGDGAGEYFLREMRGGARAAFTRSFSDALSFELRAEIEHRRGAVLATGNLVSPLPHGQDIGDALRQPSSIGTLAGSSAQLTWKPAPAWTIVSGVRLDSYHLVPRIERLALEPRLAARWTLSEALAFKGGIGLYHQPPTVLIPIPAMDLAGLRYGLQETVQTSGGVEWRDHGFEASAEAFFHPLLRAVELSLRDATASHSRPDTVGDDPASHGYAYGLELMLRRPLGRRWFGWLTYSYTHSRRWERFPRTNALGEVVGTAEGYLPFAFEQAHVLNATLSVKLPRNFTLGASFHFHTGRPESGQLASRTMRPVEDPSAGTVWKLVDRDQVARLPSYVRIDFRASKSWAFESFTLEAYLDVFNIALRQEVYGYQYNTDALGAPAKYPLTVPLLMPLLGVKGAY